MCCADCKGRDIKKLFFRRKNEAKNLSAIPADRVIELFAIACEKLNDFARSMSSPSLFRTGRTFADIRNYASGWRLEKYVEASVWGREDEVAAWCLELGKEERWIVQASVNLAHSEIYLELVNSFAETEEELELALNKAITVLVSEAEVGSRLHQLLTKKHASE
jgi:hypothetical protein